MDDATFGQLLDYLKLSWKGYRKVRKGVKKRIRRHMRDLNCRSLQDYLDLLDRNPRVRDACDRLMTVSISRFFRDRLLWQVLEERLMPELIDRFPDKIRVWSAGCACGEEALSLAIVWAHLEKRRRHLPAIDILATDTNAASLEHAQRGRYPRSSLKELPDDVRASWFKPQRSQKQFAIQPSLTRDVRFLWHDLLSAPPEQRFQVILLRNNLLTYYRDEIKIPVFIKILDTLETGGVLIIGSHEHIPVDTADLRVDPQLNYVFQSVA